MKAEIEITGRVEALALRPGDVVVVHCEQMLSAEYGSTLKAHIEKQFPGHGVIVISGGLDLCVVREGPA